MIIFTSLEGRATLKEAALYKGDLMGKLEDQLKIVAEINDINEQIISNQKEIIDALKEEVNLLKKEVEIYKTLISAYKKVIGDFK